MSDVSELGERIKYAEREQTRKDFFVILKIRLEDINIKWGVFERLVDTPQLLEQIIFIKNRDFLDADIRNSFIEDTGDFFKRWKEENTEESQEVVQALVNALKDWRKSMEQAKDSLDKNEEVPADIESARIKKAMEDFDIFKGISSIDRINLISKLRELQKGGWKESDVVNFLEHGVNIFLANQDGQIFRKYLRSLIRILGGGEALKESGKDNDLLTILSDDELLRDNLSEKQIVGLVRVIEDLIKKAKKNGFLPQDIEEFPDLLHNSMSDIVKPNVESPEVVGPEETKEGREKKSIEKSALHADLGERVVDLGGKFLNSYLKKIKK